MQSLDRNIWHSNSTTTETLIYNVYFHAVLLYVAETWTLTKVLSAKIDSFDQWISGVNGEYYVSITASMCPITRYAAALTAYQRPKSSNHVVSSCLAILQELTWHWTIIVLQYEAHHPRGTGLQDDRDRHGHEQSRLICAL